MTKVFWLVVYNKQTGEFSKAWGEGIKEELAEETFELTHNDLKVIHSGEGNHPKTYQGLIETK